MFLVQHEERFWMVLLHIRS